MLFIGVYLRIYLRIYTNKTSERSLRYLHTGTWIKYTNVAFRISINNIDRSLAQVWIERKISGIAYQLSMVSEMIRLKWLGKQKWHGSLEQSLEGFEFNLNCLFETLDSISVDIRNCGIHSRYWHRKLQFNKELGGWILLSQFLKLLTDTM